MSQLSLSDAFGFEAVRAAIAFLRPAGSLSSCTRGAILMTALLVGALAGIAPARAQNVFPVGVLSNTATVGVPYSSTYKCEVGFNNVNAAVCTAADVRAACIACTWLPDRISDQTTREAITRLARALGTDLAWHERAGR